MSLVPPPQEASDIFSLSDQALSERYQFVEEIGFGNWGSVWLCRPKDENGKLIEDGHDSALGKVAVKLVHRSKTPTTAARVRSLWNEMKIVRSFKNDPHPSIIPFHNFIITPSYALITMSYLPMLVPVEVPELRAKPWFLSLISAVAFLHARGVVHNDIKPANILLTATDPPVPVLVDFGFAEKYDARSSKAFLSNLAYGTPEYLSPERARGLPHDTRKSDVWSLGVTLFEILAGRTPFEHAEPDGTTETFSTKADLEKYWARTVKGKWVGKWSMSRGLEKLLRKMILPNADLRITAPVALNDPYFDPTKPETPRNVKLRSSLHMHSPSSDADASRLVDIAPPWADRSGGGFSPPASLLKTVAAAGRRENKENVRARLAPAGKENAAVNVRRENLPGHQKTKSQSHVGKAAVAPSRLPALVQPFKHAARKAQSFHNNATSPSSNVPSPAPLAPRRTGNGSTNTALSAANASVLSASSADLRGNSSYITANSLTSKENSVPGSRTGSSRRIPTRKPVPAIFAAAHKGKAVEEPDNIANTLEEDRQWDKDRRRKSRVLVDLTKVKTNGSAREEGMTTPVHERGDEKRPPLSPVVEIAPPDSPRLFPNDTFPRSTKESTGIGAIKQSIRQSLDKGVRLYKSSALGSYSNILSRQSTGGLSAVAPDGYQESEDRPSEETRESWEHESAVRNAKSSLPVVRHAIHNEQVAADNRLDRMTIWIRNVEKVVEDARANFAAGSMTPLPPLPPRVAHTRTASRRGPKVDQIFRDESAATPVATSSADESGISRPRRATLLSRSPEAPTRDSLERARNSPSAAVGEDSGRTKAQSALDLSRPISDPAKLRLEIEQPDFPPRSPTRLSAVIDPNAFFVPRHSEEQENATNAERFKAFLTPPDSLRTSSAQSPQLDHDVEGAYDRFLLSTSSVKRIGKGYQSNLTTLNVVDASVTSFKRNPTHFNSTRRGMQAPLETPRKAASVDELGALNSISAVSRREDGNNTIKLMRRAFKAITGGSVSRRLSRAV